MTGVTAFVAEGKMLWRDLDVHVRQNEMEFVLAMLLRTKKKLGLIS